MEVVVVAVEEGVEAGVEEGIVAINRVNSKEEGDGIKQHNKGVMVDNKQAMEDNKGVTGGNKEVTEDNKGMVVDKGDMVGVGEVVGEGEVEIGTEGEEVVDDIDSLEPVLHLPILMYHHVVKRIRLVRITYVKKAITLLHYHTVYTATVLVIECHFSLSVPSSAMLERSQLFFPEVLWEISKAHSVEQS